MNRQRKASADTGAASARPTFWNGVFTAVGLALFGAVSGYGFALVGGEAFAFRATTTLLATVYVGYLFYGTHAKIGRVVTACAYLVGVALAWALAPSTMAFLAIHVGAVWLIRSLYFHSGILTAIADMSVAVVGVTAAAMTASHTHSALLAIWAFFLVQALFVLIPQRLQAPSPVDQPDRFRKAHRMATAAVEKLHA